MDESLHLLLLGLLLFSKRVSSVRPHSAIDMFIIITICYGDIQCVSNKNRTGFVTYFTGNVALEQTSK